MIIVKNILYVLDVCDLYSPRSALHQTILWNKAMFGEYIIGNTPSVIVLHFTAVPVLFHLARPKNLNRPRISTAVEFYLPLLMSFFLTSCCHLIWRGWEKSQSYFDKRSRKVHMSVFKRSESKKSSEKSPGMSSKSDNVLWSSLSSHSRFFTHMTTPPTLYKGMHEVSYEK